LRKGFDEAFIASNFYIKEMVLPLREGQRNKIHTAIFKADDEENVIWGLSGTSITYDKNVAILDSSKRNVSQANSFLKIWIPDKAFFLDLTKSFENQNEILLSGIFNQENLAILFKSDIRNLKEKIDKALENVPENENFLAIVNSELHEFFEAKRNFLSKFESCEDFINFLNKENKEHDPNQTSAFLYHCGIKGILYEDSTGDRVLLFNPESDIEVEESFRLKNLNM